MTTPATRRTVPARTRPNATPANPGPDADLVDEDPPEGGDEFLVLSGHSTGRITQLLNRFAPFGWAPHGPVTSANGEYLVTIVAPRGTPRPTAEKGTGAVQKSGRRT